MTRRKDHPIASKEALQKLITASNAAVPGSAQQYKITKVMVVIAMQRGADTVAYDGLRVLYSHGERNDPVAWSWVNMELSEQCYRLGKMEEARRLLTVAMALTRTTIACRSSLPKRLVVASKRALSAGDVVSSWEMMVEAFEVALDLWGATDVRVVSRMLDLGKLSVQRGRLTEAIGWFEGAIAALAGVDEQSQRIRRASANLLLTQLVVLAGNEMKRTRKADAYALAERGVAIGQPILGNDHTLVRQLQRFL